MDRNRKHCNKYDYVQIPFITTVYFGIYFIVYRCDHDSSSIMSYVVQTFSPKTVCRVHRSVESLYIYQIESIPFTVLYDHVLI